LTLFKLDALLTHKYTYPPSYSSPTGIKLCPSSCRNTMVPDVSDRVEMVNSPPKPP